MWGNWDSHILLVGMQKDSAAVENNKQKKNSRLSNYSPGKLEGIQNQGLNKKLYINCHSSSIHNRQKERNKPNIYRQMNG